MSELNVLICFADFFLVVLSRDGFPRFVMKVNLVYLSDVSTRQQWRVGVR